MKSLTLRGSVVLACALSLAGCGGNSGSLVLAGSVIGLNKQGLVLVNNGGDPLQVQSGATTFTFDQLLGNDADYNVTVQTQPSAAVCTVTNGTGRTSTFNITSVIVNCVTNSYDIGGTVSGLTGTGLVLVNGQDRQTINANGAFTMTVTNATGAVVSGRVPDGSPYGVTVLTQPAGQTCTVANGVGTLGSTALNNIAVTCV